jgi:hypothetical protein
VRSRDAWLLGGAAIVGGAVLGALRRFRAHAAAPTTAPAPDARAEHLRRKLDESRSLIDEPEQFSSAETPVDRAEATASDLEERRRQVHERARGVADEMREGPG